MAISNKVGPPVTGEDFYGRESKNWHAPTHIFLPIIHLYYPHLEESENHLLQNDS